MPVLILGSLDIDWNNWVDTHLNFWLVKNLWFIACSCKLMLKILTMTAYHASNQQKEKTNLDYFIKNNSFYYS